MPRRGPTCQRSYPLRRVWSIGRHRLRPAQFRAAETDVDAAAVGVALGEICGVEVDHGDAGSSLCWLFLANDFVAVEVGDCGGREEGGGCCGGDGECEQCGERSEGDGGSGVGELEVGVAADEGGDAGEYE